MESLSKGIKYITRYLNRSMYNHSNPCFQESGMLVLPHSLRDSEEFLGKKSSRKGTGYPVFLQGTHSLILV